MLEKKSLSINRNEFFKQVFLKICNGLDIERSFAKAIQYMRQIIPLKGVTLYFFDSADNRLNEVLKVGIVESSSLVDSISIGDSKCIDYLKHPGVMIDGDEGFIEISKLFSSSDINISLMKFRSKEIYVVLLFFADVEKLFSPIHKDLLTTLIDPFNVAINNYIEHSASANQNRSESEGSLKLDAVVSSHIKKVLTITNGRVHGKNGAAEILDINSSTLRSRMKKMGIPYGRTL